MFGLVIAYFASQNTGSITLNFLNYTFPSVPLYIALSGAVLLGLGFSWLVMITKSISTGFAMRGKENKINDIKKENNELARRNHQLELENTKLEGKTSSTTDDKSL